MAEKQDNDLKCFLGLRLHPFEKVICMYVRAHTPAHIHTRAHTYTHRAHRTHKPNFAPRKLKTMLLDLFHPEEEEY